jgi:hypothetical protein
MHQKGYHIVDDADIIAPIAMLFAAFVFLTLQYFGA